VNEAGVAPVEDLAVSIIPPEEESTTNVEAIPEPKAQVAVKAEPEGLDQEDLASNKPDLQDNDAHKVPAVEQSSFGTDFSMIEPVAAPEVDVAQVMRHNEMMKRKINGLTREKVALTE